MQSQRRDGGLVLDVFVHPQPLVEDLAELELPRRYGLVLLVGLFFFLPPQRCLAAAVLDAFQAALDQRARPRLCVAMRVVDVGQQHPEPLAVVALVPFLPNRTEVKAQGLARGFVEPLYRHEQLRAQQLTLVAERGGVAVMAIVLIVLMGPVQVFAQAPVEVLGGVDHLEQHPVFGLAADFAVKFGQLFRGEAIGAEGVQQLATEQARQLQLHQQRRRFGCGRHQDSVAPSGSGRDRPGLSRPVPSYSRPAARTRPGSR